MWLSLFSDSVRRRGRLSCPQIAEFRTRQMDPKVNSPQDLCFLGVQPSSPKSQFLPSLNSRLSSWLGHRFTTSVTCSAFLQTGMARMTAPCGGGVITLIWMGHVFAIWQYSFFSSVEYCLEKGRWWWEERTDRRQCYFPTQNKETRFTIYRCMSTTGYYIADDDSQQSYQKE